MAFQLKATESVSDGIKRNVRHQIEKALDHLSAKGKAHRTRRVGERGRP